MCDISDIKKSIMGKNNINRTILITGAIAGLLAVLLGAFGAHGLKNAVDAQQVASFTTGVRYQMYHAIMCLVIGNMTFLSNMLKKRIFYFFLSGMLFFSGSIYLLVLDEVLGIDASSIGFITPVGGLLLILGWVLLVFSFVKNK